MFPSDGTGRPLDRDTLRSALARALHTAGISDNGRHLVVHSFRNAYVTLLRGTLPDDALRALSGHAAIAMTEHHDHPSADQRIDSLEYYRRALQAILGLEA